MALLGVTLAQDATGTTEGRLGAPEEVVLGELFDVVGYEVVPSDVEVKVEYSGHFALEGGSCGSPVGRGLPRRRRSHVGYATSLLSGRGLGAAGGVGHR